LEEEIEEKVFGEKTRYKNPLGGSPAQGVFIPKIFFKNFSKI
jgi:hypothetical protein